MGEMILVSVLSVAGAALLAFAGFVIFSLLVMGSLSYDRGEKAVCYFVAPSIIIGGLVCVFYASKHIIEHLEWIN